MDVKQLLRSIQRDHDKLLSEISETKKEMGRLDAEGLDYGSPSYKAGRYLRIVRPATGGRDREFAYIGADPDKQAAALAAIERGRAYDQLARKLARLQHARDQLPLALHGVAREFASTAGLRGRVGQ